MISFNVDDMWRKVRESQRTMTKLTSTVVFHAGVSPVRRSQHR